MLFSFEKESVGKKENVKKHLAKKTKTKERKKKVAKE